VNNQDRQPFMEVLISTGELYEKHISDTLLELYFNILKHYSIEDIKRGIAGHIRDTKAGQYFPKPADILRQILGDDDGRAIAAWVEVRKAIQHVGIYKSVKFDDPVIMMCIDRMGGWQELCNILTSEVGYKEAEFIKLYKHYQHFPIDNAPKYLVGWHEQQNRFNGYSDAIPEPLEIKTQRELPSGKQMIKGGIT